jgi:hypothetical protein
MKQKQNFSHSFADSKTHKFEFGTSSLFFPVLSKSKNFQYLVQLSHLIQAITIFPGGRKVGSPVARRLGALLFLCELSLHYFLLGLTAYYHSNYLSRGLLVL